MTTRGGGHLPQQDGKATTTGAHQDTTFARKHPDKQTQQTRVLSLSHAQRKSIQTHKHTPDKGTYLVSHREEAPRAQVRQAIRLHQAPLLHLHEPAATAPTPHAAHHTKHMQRLPGVGSTAAAAATTTVTVTTQDDISMGTWTHFG